MDSTGQPSNNSAPLTLEKNPPLVSIHSPDGMCRASERATAKIAEAARVEARKMASSQKNLVFASSEGD